jgi:hypothetical protein
MVPFTLSALTRPTARCTFTFAPSGMPISTAAHAWSPELPPIRTPLPSWTSVAAAERPVAAQVEIGVGVTTQLRRRPDPRYIREHNAEAPQRAVVIGFEHELAAVGSLRRRRDGHCSPRRGVQRDGADGIEDLDARFW